MRGLTSVRSFQQTILPVTQQHELAMIATFQHSHMRRSSISISFKWWAPLEADDCTSEEFQIS